MRSEQPQAAPDRRGRPARRRYEPPRLERLGELRSLTLGTSPGVPDSGIGLTQQQQP